MNNLLILGTTLTVLVGCTDAQRSKVFSLGEGRSIECWSGGQLIYKGRSTGKISNEDNSDGYYFREEGSGKLLEVSGNCILGKD